MQEFFSFLPGWRKFQTFCPQFYFFPDFSRPGISKIKFQAFPGSADTLLRGMKTSFGVAVLLLNFFGGYSVFMKYLLKYSIFENADYVIMMTMMLILIFSINPRAFTIKCFYRVFNLLKHFVNLEDSPHFQIQYPIFWRNNDVCGISRFSVIKILSIWKFRHANELHKYENVSER